MSLQPKDWRKSSARSCFYLITELGSRFPCAFGTRTGASPRRGASEHKDSEVTSHGDADFSLYNAHMSDEGSPVSQHDPLPPWKKYPEIPCGSIGWRMGDGEAYMFSWWDWAEPKSKQYLLVYLKQHITIPVDWYMWVAARLRSNEILNEVFGGRRDFGSIHWLQEQSLADIEAFENWFNNVRPALRDHLSDAFRGERD